MEQSPCLKMLLLAAQEGIYAEWDPAQKRLAEQLREAMVVTDEVNGSYIMACRRGDCQANLGLIFKVAGIDPVIVADIGGDLSDCTYE